MKLRDRSWFAVSTTTLALLAACGPSVSIGDTEGDSEGSTGATTGTTNPDPTRPMTTTPDPSVGTGDVTGQATTIGSLVPPRWLPVCLPHWNGVFPAQAQAAPLWGAIIGAPHCSIPP